MTIEKRKKYKKKWWAANAKRIREELRTKPEYRYKSLKLRCRREGRKFSISFKNYLDKINSGCYYCGVDISDEIGGGVDRRNNKITDYTARNLVACCSDCNKIKSDRLNWKEMLVAMKAVNKFRRRKNAK